MVLNNLSDIDKSCLTKFRKGIFIFPLTQDLRKIHLLGHAVKKFTVQQNGEVTVGT